MSLLLILLPPRPRDGAAGVPSEFAWVLSGDGVAVTRQGSSSPAALPRAGSVCALLPDTELSWQRLTVPKAPAARLHDALAAVLEDTVLDDSDALHLAIEPGLAPGREGWVAVGHRRWLASLLAALDAGGATVERLVPSSWPAADETVHALPAAAETTGTRLVFAGPAGVAVLPLAGSLARQRFAGTAAQAEPRLTAHPSVAAEAERVLGKPATVLPEAERALLAARSAWNLRQFELAPQHRGLRALRDGWRRFGGAAWAPVRWGLAALVLVQLAGLNLAAWRLEQTALDKRRAMTQLLQSAHPQVRSVLDAPLQMERETESLRTAAGRTGPGDLEPLLAAAAAAWPEGQPPMQTLRFEPGRLTLGTAGWADAQRAGFAERLRASGYRAEASAGQVSIRREGSS